MIDRVDVSANAIAVKLEIFGRPVPLTFPLSSAKMYLTPFEDQPITSHCPNADTLQRDLLAQCSKADATYRTDCWWSSTTHGFVQVSRYGLDQRLRVCSHDLTWPIRKTMVWSVREVPVTAAQWTTFIGLIERCRFWHLPYDDGRRISRKGMGWRGWLEGYEGGRYQKVVRVAAEPMSEISACCEYLCALAELRPTNAEQTIAPDGAGHDGFTE